MRLHVYEDLPSWVPITSSLGPTSNKLRKRVISSMMRQLGDAAPRGALARWVANKSLAALLRTRDGRVLIWGFKDDPELLLVVATIQQVTPELRVARAMRPMSEDDTEDFPHPTLGMGERLVVAESGPAVRVTYTFDLTTHLVQVQATCTDGSRLPHDELDALVRDLRVITGDGPAPTLM